VWKHRDKGTRPLIGATSNVHDRHARNKANVRCYAYIFKFPPLPQHEPHRGYTNQYAPYPAQDHSVATQLNVGRSRKSASLTFPFLSTRAFLANTGHAKQPTSPNTTSTSDKGLTHLVQERKNVRSRFPCPLVPFPGGSFRPPLAVPLLLQKSSWWLG